MLKRTRARVSMAIGLATFVFVSPAHSRDRGCLAAVRTDGER